MKESIASSLTLIAGASGTVSALLCLPADPRAFYVFAHGAGAGMSHPFMENFAAGLAERGIASLRYQFPSMERGSKKPDSPAVAHATVRAAVEKASEILPDIPLFAGGKSFGGRMTSQAQAEAPLPHVLGLCFIGFPLHPANKPSRKRSEHLSQITCAMLFLQGTRDSLAEIQLIQTVVEQLGVLAELDLFEDADHSFHVRQRSGFNDDQVRDHMLDTMVAWIERVKTTTRRSALEGWPSI